MWNKKNKLFSPKWNIRSLSLPYVVATWGITCAISGPADSRGLWRLERWLWAIAVSDTQQPSPLIAGVQLNSRFQCEAFPAGGLVGCQYAQLTSPGVHWTHQWERKYFFAGVFFEFLFPHVHVKHTVWKHNLCFTVKHSCVSTWSTNHVFQKVKSIGVHRMNHSCASVWSKNYAFQKVKHTCASRVKAQLCSTFSPCFSKCEAHMCF